jgi:hypothetical protein
LTIRFVDGAEHEAIMIAQEILVKKHVVPLHADERSHLSPDS